MVLYKKNHLPSVSFGNGVKGALGEDHMRFSNVALSPQAGLLIIHYK